MSEKGFSRYELCTGGGNTESKSERVKSMSAKLTGEERSVLTETVKVLTEAVDVLSRYEDFYDVELIEYKLSARLEALKRIMEV